MRVCVVLNHMPAPGAGGLEGQVHDVCTGLLQTQPAAVMEATLARLSDRSIAVSQQVHDDLTRCYGVAPEEISVVYNAIDTQLFAPIPRAEARAQLGIHPDLRYVLYVG